MKTLIGINDQQRKKSIDILTIVLADEMSMYVKTRKFHWNVAGESFMELHQLFQQQYTALEETIDAIAERINQLGGNTIGTMQEFVQCTRLTEFANVYPMQKEMLVELLNDTNELIVYIRTDVMDLSKKSEDVGTIDFLTGIIRQHEKIAWILRRYLA
jgi:starvation-inducible DNA-binding protein